MEWKWIKTLLIVIFLCIDVFLGVKVYRESQAYVLNPEVVEAVKSILMQRNISMSSVPSWPAAGSWTAA